MKINVYPVMSPLHDIEEISKNSNILMQEIAKTLKCNVSISNLNHLYDSDLSLILVQSGGSEGEFLKVFDNLREPYYLLTYGNNNSLAASMEILSFLKGKNKDAEILHGSFEYISKRILELENRKNEEPIRLGVLGKPSDWLIASNVDYEDALKKHNISLIDLDIEKVIKNYPNYDPAMFKSEKNFHFDEKALNASKALVLEIDELVKEKNLSGITIRCFDFLKTIKTTACLSLALLNERGIVGTCEGDIPAMISMFISKKICGITGFQANPSRIDIINNEIVFAHCTLPFNMVNSYKLDTHFESGIGLALKGELHKEKVTIFKLSKNLKDYFVTTGNITENLNEQNLCRTQIKIHVDNNIEYFLRNPYGNHHIIIYGNYEKEIISYMQSI